MNELGIAPSIFLNPSANNSINPNAKLSLADQSSLIEDGFQNLKRDIREANKKNKMLKFLRKKAADREKIKQLQRDNFASYPTTVKNKTQKPPVDLKKEEKKKQFNSRKKRRVTCRLIYEFISVVFQSIVSIFACVVYIVSLYRKGVQDTPETHFGKIELASALLILVDYLNGMVLAMNIKKYLINFLNLVDLVTIIPVFIEHIFGSSSAVANLAFARIWRFVRFLRFFRIYKILKRINTNDVKSISSADPIDVKRKLFTIFIQILALVFISASVILTLDDAWPDLFHIRITPQNGMKEETLTFDAALYFVLITITTVGYGDMAPDTTLARITVGIFFIAAVVFISKQTSEISDLIKQGKSFSEPYKRKSNKHVLLVSASFNDLKLQRFLREFYHKDHKLEDNIKVVVISKEKPSTDVQQVLQLYEESLHLIVGSVFNEKTIDKADTQNAQAAFVLSNQYEGHSVKNDSFAVLAAKMLSEFNRNMKINVQLINKDYLIHSWSNWDNVYSIDEFKMGILAANAYNPGFCPFILNLLRSSSCINDNNKMTKLWLHEYGQGLEQEIYCIKIPKKFALMEFSFLVKMGFNGNGILVFGIRRRKPKCPFDIYEILINPQNYEIQEGDEALVLATDFAHANKFDADASAEEKSKESNIMRSAQKKPFSRKKAAARFQFNTNYDFQHPPQLVSNTDDYFLMWRDDHSEKKGHILVFGEIDQLPTLVECLRHFTQNYICYVHDKPQTEKWNKIRNRYSNVLYFECSFSDKNEFARTGIMNAKHVILLSWMLQNSNHPDSGMLQIIRIIDEHFPEVKYTIELVDETNLKYLGNKDEGGKGDLPFYFNTKYASGTVFFSSTLDAIIAQAYFNQTLFEVLDRLIFGETQEADTKVIENCKLNMIEVGPEFKTFNEFFEACMDINSEDPNTRSGQVKQIIPIAIYRAPSPKFHGNEAPYVITNPSKDIFLMSGDRIYVLGEIDSFKHRREKELRTGQDKKREIHRQKNELHEQYLKQMDDDTLLALIKKEMEKSDTERRKLQQQQERYKQELVKLNFQSRVKRVVKRARDNQLLDKVRALGKIDSVTSSNQYGIPPMPGPTTDRMPVTSMTSPPAPPTEGANVPKSERSSLSSVPLKGEEGVHSGTTPSKLMIGQNQRITIIKETDNDLEESKVMNSSRGAKMRQKFQHISSGSAYQSNIAKSGDMFFESGDEESHLKLPIHGDTQYNEQSTIPNLDLKLPHYQSQGTADFEGNLPGIEQQPKATQSKFGKREEKKAKSQPRVNLIEKVRHDGAPSLAIGVSKFDLAKDQNQ